MKVTVRITKRFQTASKPLIKRYPSFKKDLVRLENELMKNPKLGISLGNNAYKIRLKISSKSRGKGAGARIISLLETILVAKVISTENEIVVNLLYIFDKSDTATITDKELKDLIAAFYAGK